MLTISQWESFLYFHTTKNKEKLKWCETAPAILHTETEHLLFYSFSLFRLRKQKHLKRLAYSLRRCDSWTGVICLVLYVWYMVFCEG